jgi:hypothetical protein
MRLAPLLGLLPALLTAPSLLTAPALAAPVAPRRPAAEAPRPGLFGLTLGAKAEAVMADFAPVGRTETATWSSHTEGRVRRLLWTCPGETGCLSVPMSAEFSFVDGQLAATALRIDPDDAPPDLNVAPLLALQAAAAGFETPVAEATFAGTQRRRRYYRSRPGETAVWVQEGALVEVKLYLDRLHPVGFAEAVAAKARPVGLEKLPGAKAWAAAQYALDSGQSGDAIGILEDVFSARGVSPLMVAEGRLVQAMALAARAKSRYAVQPALALADLARARLLVPALGASLDQLLGELAAGSPGSVGSVPSSLP